MDGLARHLTVANAMRAASIAMLVVAYLFFWDAFFDLGKLAELIQAPFVFLVDSINYLFGWLGFDVPPLLGFGIVTATLYFALAFGHLKAGVRWKAILSVFGHLVLVLAALVGVGLMATQSSTPWLFFGALAAFAGYCLIYLPVKRPNWSEYKTPEHPFVRWIVGLFYAGLFLVSFLAIFYASIIESASRYPHIFGCAGIEKSFDAVSSCASAGMSKPEVAWILFGSMAPSICLGLLFALTHKMRIWVLILRHAITYAISGILALISMNVQIG